MLGNQVTAQGTKVKACEFYETKIDILSFVTPKYRTLVPAIDFIYILQWATHSESVKSAGKTKKPFLSRAHMGGGWSWPQSTSPGL